MTITDISEHRDIHIHCAVCKSKDPGPTMLLEPHAEPKALILIHVKCMGGLPVIALKWHIVGYTGQRHLIEEGITLLDFLSTWPTELLDFEDKGGGE